MARSAEWARGAVGRSVATVGTYDGVHLGHRRLIEETKAAAAERGIRSVVVTFAQHPSTVLRPDAPVPLLCTLEERIELLWTTGVDEIVVLEFDRSRADESAEDFVRIELVERLSVAVVLVGSSFRFGHARRGDVALLAAMGARYGFAARGIELVLDDEHHSVVSSTRIRSLLRAGEAVEASRLLGRPFVLGGPVDEKGRLAVAPELLVPPPGRYRVEVGLPGAGRGRRGEPGAVVIGPAHEVTLDPPASCGLPGAERVTVAFVGDREPAG